MSIQIKPRTFELRVQFIDDVSYCKNRMLLKYRALPLPRTISEIHIVAPDERRNEMIKL